ncbi:DsrE family protein [Nocardioides sp. NPDC000445]|uniref:DsrE family protein n=1 Tax=Nocardioides sp. NPDC000445 TaxID=3154257 RepID=UPI0033198239
MRAGHEVADGIVVQLAEGERDKMTMVVRNIENLLAALEPRCSIELVTHGAGLSAVTTGSPVSEEVLGLISRGVRVDACGNTMQRHGVARDRLLSGVSVVESGIAHLVVRQREGWAYVRP